MEPRISIVTLGVNDLSRAIEFYRQGLGLSMREEGEGIAFFQMGGAWLALYPWKALAEDALQPEEGTGFRGVTLAHNVHSPGEVNRVMSEAARAGARIVKPAADTFWGGYSGYFADPDGHLWEVAYNPHFQID